MDKKVHIKVGLRFSNLSIRWQCKTTNHSETKYFPTTLKKLQKPGHEFELKHYYVQGSTPYMYIFSFRSKCILQVASLPLAHDIRNFACHLPDALYIQSYVHAAWCLILPVHVRCTHSLSSHLRHFDSQTLWQFYGEIESTKSHYCGSPRGTSFVGEGTSWPWRSDVPSEFWGGCILWSIFYGVLYSHVGLCMG